MKIIDTHAHAIFPQAISAYAADLVASRANPTVGGPRQPITDEMLHEPMVRHLAQMDKVGTDMQIISPRPFMQLHSVDPAAVTQAWVRYNTPPSPGRSPCSPTGSRAWPGCRSTATWTWRR